MPFSVWNYTKVPVIEDAKTGKNWKFLRVSIYILLCFFTTLLIF